MTPTDTFDLGGSSFGFSNFNPDDLQTDNTINAVFIIDVSPSIRNYVQAMNTVFAEVINELQQSHVGDRLLVKIITFNETVTELTGFQPVKLIDPSKYTFTPSGSGTALFAAVDKGVATAYDYRVDLENSGVNCTTFIFTITDGEDNSSGRIYGSTVLKRVSDIRKKEQNALTFELVLFGVGDALSFESSALEMGIQKTHVATVGTGIADIRKMFGVVSASLSRSQSIGQINF